MAVPDFQTLMRPVLAVHQDGQPHSAAEIRDKVAAQVGITDEERQVLLPSGRVARYTNRIAWAITHMAQARLLDRPRRGLTQITDRGRQVLASHSQRVDMSVLTQFEEYREFRKRSHPDKNEAEPTAPPVTDTAPPREAIEDVLREAHSALATDLLARVLKQPPQFLEDLVLKLLVRMGYGGLEQASEHLGGIGDRGLDGLIRQDPLGLDVVYVQAKRYTDQSVGRPDIQAFVGALHGAQATRGIFVTTSGFTRDARDYADRVNARLVLIDGLRLAELMIEHNCGITVQETFVLKQIDENFFDET